VGVRKTIKKATYLKVDSAFELLNVFTENNESPSAQTSSKRYTTQSSATQTITGYEWSSSFTGDQMESDKVVEHIRNIGEMCLTGADAESEYLIVDLDQPGTVEGTFRARKIKVAIQVDEFPDNDGELGLSGNFLGQGDPILGTFTLTGKTFAEGFTAAV
jgi:hypothetical protein